MACDARYPGSVHDAAVWQMSDMKTFFRSNYLNGDKDSHLIGDSGYPLQPYLLTPIFNPTTIPEIYKYRNFIII